MDAYKKKYKEALERARIWQNHLYETNDKGDRDYADELNYIFPELRESINERVKKVIKQVLNESTTEKDECYSNNRVTQQEVFAWLEKQGENNMGISEATKQKLEDNLNKALEKETPESWNEFLEKQGEQRPAWSEEDEKIYNLLYEEYKDLAYYSHSREKTEDVPGEVLGWLKSLKDRVQPRPKQE